MEKNLTPQFRQAIQKYYQTEGTKLDRTCDETGTIFTIFQDSYLIYKQLDIPLPTSSPGARLRRLRAHMGGIELFKQRDIHGTEIISMYDPDSPAKIVTRDHWFSDEFDALTYGTPLESSQSFFTQWGNFSPSVPRSPIDSDPNSENCTWCSYDLSFKDCYATYGGIESNRLIYADMCTTSQHSVDITNIVKSEWSYESVSCLECSRAFYSSYCSSSYDIAFCFGCRNVSDCFGCVNLQNKKYCFFNRQLTKEEYFRFVSALDLRDATIVNACKQKSQELWNNGYLEANSNFSSERASGDEIISSRDVTGISTLSCERVYNAYDIGFIKNSCDMTTCSKMEKSVQCVSCTDGFENKMCVSCYGCINIEYCEHCVACENIFGCIGLKHKKFCIFNVQYTEEEYWKKVDEIKTNMLLQGEYGQFFPYRLSLFAYNTSHADAFFPLEKHKAESLGSRWYQTPLTSPTEPRIVPDLSGSTDDTITQTIFTCPKSGRGFRIVKPELNFHRKLKLALPDEHPSIRRKKRYHLMGDIQLYERSCTICHTSLYTRFSSQFPQKIVCSECFNKVLIEDRMIENT